MQSSPSRIMSSRRFSGGAWGSTGGPKHTSKHLARTTFPINLSWWLKHIVSCSWEDKPLHILMKDQRTEPTWIVNNNRVTFDLSVVDQLAVVDPGCFLQTLLHHLLHLLWRNRGGDVLHQNLKEPQTTTSQRGCRRFCSGWNRNTERFIWQAVSYHADPFDF